MDELKKRIMRDAEIAEGDIIRVDMFLNHCMDVDLLEKVGKDLAKRFRGDKVDKVLTVESSGIPLACFIALALDVPAIYAKRFHTGYIDPDVYTAEIHSFSMEKSYTIRVSRRCWWTTSCPAARRSWAWWRSSPRRGRRWPVWPPPSRRRPGTEARSCGRWASGWRPRPRCSGWRTGTSSWRRTTEPFWRIWD